MGENEAEQGGRGAAGGPSRLDEGRLGRLEEKLDRLEIAVGDLGEKLGRSPRAAAPDLRGSRTVSPFWGLVLVIAGLIWLGEGWPMVHRVIPPFLLVLGILLIVIPYLRR